MKVLLSIETQTSGVKYKKSLKQYPKNTTITHEDSNYIGTDLTAHAARTLTNDPTLYISNNISNVSKYLLVEILTKILSVIEIKFHITIKFQ